MGFNYQAEKAKFDRKWEALQAEYEEAGMREDAIQEMREYDWMLFKQERRWCLHTTFLPDLDSNIDFTEESYGTSIISDFSENLSVSDKYTTASRHGWLDQLDNEAISCYLKTLSDEDREILTLYFLDQYTLCDVGRQIGKTKQAVSYKINKILKILKSF